MNTVLSKNIRTLLTSALMTAMILVGFFTSVSANHSTFSASIDSIELSGNGLGTLSDDFNDSTLPSAGTGTVSESGTVITTEAPGDHSDALSSLWPINLESSGLILPDSYNITNGNGNFVATSTWSQTDPTTAEYHVFMMVYPTVTSTVKVVSNAYLNNPPAIAALTGWSSGLIFAQAHVTVDTSSSTDPKVTAIDIETSPLSTSTGDIVLAQSFDDSADEVTTIFSNDGGTTQTSPFTAIDVSAITGEGFFGFQTGTIF